MSSVNAQGWPPQASLLGKRLAGVAGLCSSMARGVLGSGRGGAQNGLRCPCHLGHRGDTVISLLGESWASPLAGIKSFS